MSVHTLREFINRSYPTAAGLSALTAALDAKANNAPLDPALAARIKELLSALGAGDVLDGVSADRRRRRFFRRSGTCSGFDAKLLYRADTRHLLELRDDPLLQEVGDFARFHALGLARNVVPALEGLSERFGAVDAGFLDIGVGVGGLAVELARQCAQPAYRRHRRVQALAPARARERRESRLTAIASSSASKEPRLSRTTERSTWPGCPLSSCRSALFRKRPSARTARCVPAAGWCSRSSTLASRRSEPPRSGGCARPCLVVRCGFRAKWRNWPATTVSSMSGPCRALPVRPWHSSSVGAALPEATGSGTADDEGSLLWYRRGLELQRSRSQVR